MFFIQFNSFLLEISELLVNHFSHLLWIFLQKTKRVSNGGPWDFIIFRQSCLIEVWSESVVDKRIIMVVVILITTVAAAAFIEIASSV